MEKVSFWGILKMGGGGGLGCVGLAQLLGLAYHICGIEGENFLVDRGQFTKVESNLTTQEANVTICGR